MESTIIYRISNEIECSKYLTIRSVQKTSPLVFIYDENEKKRICNHLHEKENLLQWLESKKTQSDFACPICNSDSELHFNDNIMNMNSSSINTRDRNLRIQLTQQKPRTQLIPQEPMIQLIQQGSIFNIEETANGIKSIPTGAVIAPNDNKALYIIQQYGKVWRFDLEKQKVDPEPFFDITEKIEKIPRLIGELSQFDDERGLLGFAFHPHYGKERSPFKDIFFTVYSTERKKINYDHNSVLSRWRKNPDTEEFEEFKILEIDQPEMNHNGGTILFGPPQEDSRGIGYLYYGVGDGGGFGDLHGERIDPSDKNSVLGNAQNLETHLGKILRIDVNVKFDFISKITGKPYLIPLGNPSEIRERIVTSQQRKMIIFPVILREIYAYGLRNPWKFSFDKNGRLFIADVGQHKIEEVNLIKSGSLLRNYGPNPLNFGWRALEGGVTLKDINVFNNKVLERIGGYENTIPPILEYDRTKFKEKESAIIGGYMYDGFEIPTLKDKYVFGDFNGKIFYSFEIVIDPTKSKWIMDELIFKDKHELKGLSQDIENIENDRIRIPSFAIDFMGELYVFKINTTKKPGSLGKAGLYKFVSFDLTKEEIDSIFENTEKVASKTTSGIRNKSNGVATCKMHISIYTLSGYLKTYSMEDAWIGSVDISRSKAFTATAFSSNENALTSRTIGELSQTGPWNASKDEPFDKNRPPLYGIETSNPQYGITSFPGGIPIYKNEKLVGGLGVSGDTVDNDEKVAFEGLSEKFQPPENIRIDTVNDKLRYIK